MSGWLVWCWNVKVRNTGVRSVGWPIRCLCILRRGRGRSDTRGRRGERGGKAILGGVVVGIWLIYIDCSACLVFCEAVVVGGDGDGDGGDREGCLVWNV